MSTKRPFEYADVQSVLARTAICLVATLGASSNGIAQDALFSSDITIDGNFDGAVSVYVADMDGDEDLDVLAAGKDANEVAWWENDGNPALGGWTKYIVDTINDVRSVSAADLDNDGDKDVIGASYTANSIEWWDNLDGSGTLWTKHTLTMSFSEARAVHAADINGDGNVDILACSFGGATIKWWENDGTPANDDFVEHLLDDAFVNPNSVYAADIDGDGDLDVIATGHEGAGEIALFVNTNGAGTSWQEVNIFTEYDQGVSVSAADVNGDGDLDVVAGANASGLVSWFKNDGTPDDGGWVHHSADGAYPQTLGVAAGDIDGDLDIDLAAVAAEPTGNQASWWANLNGLGTAWSEHTINDSYLGGSSIQLADIDDDGDLDIVGTARGTDDVTWWENQRFLSPLSHSYVYDDLDRLSGIVTNQGIRISYTYDASGNRQQKEVTSQLVVSKGLSNAEFDRAATNETNMPMLHATFGVNDEEDLNLDRVVVETSGTGNESSALTEARLWVDVNGDGMVDGGDTQIGSTITSFSNDGDVVFSGLGRTLNASSMTQILLTYTFSGSPGLGDTFNARLADRKSVSASGLSSGNPIYVLGTPVIGRLVTISTDGTEPTFSGLDTAVAQTGAVQLAWAGATDTTSPITYRIWQSISSFGGSVSGPPDYSTTNTTFTVSELINGQTYYFVVRAEDGVGNRETNTVERSATPQAVTYSLAVNAVNGSAFPLPPDGVYEDGTDVSLIPNPDEGFAFAGWTGDVPGGQELDDPLILTMDADKSVTANFASAVGTVQVDTTPDDAPWSFVDGLGNIHNGAGDDTLSPIPTGGIEVTWQNRSGYLLPPLNPAVEVVPAGGTVALMGEYVLPISFDAHPQSLKRYVGASASFSVAASGGLGTAQYTWKFDDGANPVTGVGGNSATYSIPFVALDHNGSYTCEVEDNYPAVYNSATAILQVAPHLTISSHPQDATKHEQQSYTFTVSTTGGIGAKSYVWRKGGTIIPGATGASYTIPSLTLDDAGSYAVTITDEHTDSVLSNAAVLTVNEGAAPLGDSAHRILRVVFLGLFLLLIGARIARRSRALGT